MGIKGGRIGIVREGVLDGGVLRVEFTGEISFGNRGIMRRKMVALVTERADPDLGGEINARESVESGSTCFAT